MTTTTPPAQNRVLFRNLGEGAMASCSNPAMARLNDIDSDSSFFSLSGLARSTFMQRVEKNRLLHGVDYRREARCSLDCTPFEPARDIPHYTVTDAWLSVDDEDPERGPLWVIKHEFHEDDDGGPKITRVHAKGCPYFSLELRPDEEPRIIMPGWSR